MGRMSDLALNIMAYEEGSLSRDDALDLFQKLVDTGMAWQLQGHYGRTAQRLIDAGYLTPKGESCEPGVRDETRRGGRVHPVRDAQQWGDAGVGADRTHPARPNVSGG